MTRPHRSALGRTCSLVPPPRASQRFTNKLDKISSRVHFPARLDVSSLLCDGEEPPPKNVNELTARASLQSGASDESSYELYALVEHQGGYGQGHYRAFAKLAAPAADGGAPRPYSLSARLPLTGSPPLAGVPAAAAPTSWRFFDDSRTGDAREEVRMPHSHAGIG